MTELKSTQKDFLLYSGWLGLGIGLVCLFQQFYIIDADLEYALIFGASLITGIIAFVMVLLQHKEAGSWLIAATVMLFLRQAVIAWLMLKYGMIMFSLLQLTYVVFTTVITILFFASDYNPLLKKIAAEKKAEKDYWKNNTY